MFKIKAHFKIMVYVWLCVNFIALVLFEYFILHSTVNQTGQDTLTQTHNCKLLFVSPAEATLLSPLLISDWRPIRGLTSI